MTLWASLPPWAEELSDRILLLDDIVFRFDRLHAAGVLVIVPAEDLARRDLQAEKVGNGTQVGVPYIYVSEETSDTADVIDPHKLVQTGCVLTLALMRMAGEARY